MLEGINPGAVRLIKSGNHILVVIQESASGANDGGTIFLSDAYSSYYDRGVDQISFADGAVWGRTQFQSFAWTAGTSGNDALIGTAGADRLYAAEGNDRVTGGAGNDTIDGGAGQDVAVFSGDQSTYSISTSNGTLQVTDNNVTADGNDGIDTLIGMEIAEFKGGAQVSFAAPIVLDLDGDGVTLVSKSRSHAKFDWNGDGKGDQTGWIGKNDGFLVFDRDFDGKVSGASELSFIGDKPGAKSDLDGLSAFDNNGDGSISEADRNFSSFKIWRDRNGNGQSDQGELTSLKQAGIDSIGLSGESVNKVWDWDENFVINTGFYTRSDGSTVGLEDVVLNYDAALHSMGQANPSNPAAGTQENAPTVFIRNAASKLVEAIASFGLHKETGDMSGGKDFLNGKEFVLAVNSRFAGL